MTVECIDLRATFGEVYRIGREEPANSRWTDPWYQQIPCKFGHIYAHGGDELGFSSAKTGGIAKRVAALPFTTVEQGGSDGMNVTFHVRNFPEVAQIVAAKKRKRLSPEQKDRLEAARKKFRLEHPDWKPGQTIANEPNSTLERAQAVSGDSEHQEVCSEAATVQRTESHGRERNQSDSHEMADPIQRLLF